MRSIIEYKVQMRSIIEYKVQGDHEENKFATENKLRQTRNAFIDLI